MRIPIEMRYRTVRVWMSCSWDTSASVIRWACVLWAMAFQHSGGEARARVLLATKAYSPIVGGVLMERAGALGWRPALGRPAAVGEQGERQCRIRA